MQRRQVVLLLASAAIGGSSSLQALPLGEQAQSNRDHVAWTAGVLKRMGTIKPGMTRRDLLVVFTTEGGLSTRSRRTFVSRDCPFFKTDIEFQAVNRTNQEGSGGVSLESNDDIILKISTPYLQFSVMD